MLQEVKHFACLFHLSIANKNVACSVIEKIVTTSAGTSTTFTAATVV